MLRDLSREFELITYDGRGTGLADRDVDEFSLETMIADMETVADANGLEQFSLVAYSQSVAVAIAYAVRHPERVSRMVLYGGFAHNFRTRDEIAAMATLFRQSWGQANPATRQLFTAALWPDSTREEFDAFNELQRESISPDTAAHLFTACHSIDVREQARAVAVPTLVMHSRYEPGVPLECSREIAALIPNARFVILDSRNHLVLEREPAYQHLMKETIAFLKAD
jgi:pimeloyl-ACP methyl ester carboxylesterase